MPVIFDPAQPRHPYGTDGPEGKPVMFLTQFIEAAVVAPVLVVPAGHELRDAFHPVFRDEMDGLTEIHTRIEPIFDRIHGTKHEFGEFRVDAEAARHHLNGLFLFFCHKPPKNTLLCSKHPSRGPPERRIWSIFRKRRTMRCRNASCTGGRRICPAL